MINIYTTAMNLAKKKNYDYWGLDSESIEGRVLSFIYHLDKLTDEEFYLPNEIISSLFKCRPITTTKIIDKLMGLQAIMCVNPQEKSENKKYMFLGYSYESGNEDW